MAGVLIMAECNATVSISITNHILSYIVVVFSTTSCFKDTIDDPQQCSVVSPKMKVMQKEVPSYSMAV